MTYKVEFSKGATKQLKKLSPELKDRIQNPIDNLRIDPRPNGVKKLQGDDNLYRIRVGDYSVIYEIQDDILLVIVIKVKHRNQVYQDDS